MGLLDDAIRQHLDLKRAHGADEAELKRKEDEALGPVRREAEPAADEAGESCSRSPPKPVAEEPPAEPWPRPVAEDPPEAPVAFTDEEPFADDEPFADAPPAAEEPPR